MIPKDCKRLAEVDFPIAEVSRHAVREKSIRHGHPSTLVTKVTHHYLSVDVLTRSMQMREESPPNGNRESGT